MPLPEQNLQRSRLCLHFLHRSIAQTLKISWYHFMTQTIYPVSSGPTKNTLQIGSTDKYFLKDLLIQRQIRCIVLSFVSSLQKKPVTRLLFAAIAWESSDVHRRCYRYGACRRNRSNRRPASPGCIAAVRSCCRWEAAHSHPVETAAGETMKTSSLCKYFHFRTYPLLAFYRKTLSTH